MPRWKPNHGREMPRNLLFFDTESYRIPVKHSYYDSYLTLRLGVADYVNWRGRRKDATQTSHFRDCKSFWDFLDCHLRSKEILWVHAHNIMFDLSMVQWGNELSSGRLSICDNAATVNNAVASGKNKKVFKGRFNTSDKCTIIECKYKGKRVNFIDTYNYFRTSVEKIGESIGVQKLPMPTDDDTEERWFHYCSRDVDIIREAICTLMLEWELNNHGNWQPTLASLAFSSFRHMFMSVPPCPHRNLSVSMFESKSYHDGRTQLYWRGDIRNKYAGGSVFGSECTRDVLPWRDGPSYVLDVSSLYPYVMRENYYPRRVLGDYGGKSAIISEPSYQTVRDCLDHCLAVATVELRTDVDDYPLELNGRLTYPVGNFITTLCTPELRLAFDQGHVAKVLAVAVYEPAKMFVEFVDYWWGRRIYWRERGNKIREQLCKDVMNALHGKLGQRKRYWENIVGRKHHMEWTEWMEYHTKSRELTYFRSIGKQVQVLINDGWADCALVATAAHVNSYARVYMRHLRGVAGRENVYYQGNDSLIVNGLGYDRLNNTGFLSDREIGKLKLQGVYEECKLWGSRDYELGSRVVKAGIPSTAERIAARQWKFDVFEDSDTLLLRKPDGTVRISKRVCTGGDPLEILHFDANGWYVPTRLTLTEKTSEEIS